MARGQRLVFKCLEGQEFRCESGVPTVGSFGMLRKFRHLTYFNSVIVVFKYAEGREFRHLSRVPMPHNDTVTQLPLAQCKSYIPDVFGMATAIKRLVFPQGL